MNRLNWSFLLVLMQSLMVVASAQAGTSLARWRQPLLDTSETKQAASTASTFAEARRLSQQGKFDEAIAQLEALLASRSDAKGLSHEMGVVYYKKGDYLKATASFKKALADDPSDN